MAFINSRVQVALWLFKSHRELSELSLHVYSHDFRSARDVRAALEAEAPVLHAPLIAPPTHPYTGARSQRGCVPRANCDTTSGLQVQYTRELQGYCTWRAPPHRPLDTRPSIYA